MGDNRRFLIHQLVDTQLLNNRFSHIQVINCDAITGAHKPDGGMLSVVFRAIDNQTSCPVAIKFFDPDASQTVSNYRSSLFERECELLTRIAGHERCVQLIQPITQLNLRIAVDRTKDLYVSIPTRYFVVEWLSKDVLNYFHNQQDFSALEKLQIYREIILAVLSLHNAGMYHRDLKPDNIRIAKRNGVRCIVAIDLGTAAMLESPTLGSALDYSDSVGAPYYAPIEARCGLSGVRTLGIHGDMYTLGCLLHDLFNLETFTSRLYKDPGFSVCLGTCKAHMTLVFHSKPPLSTALLEWRKIIVQMAPQVTTPKIDGPGTSVPLSLRQLLDKLLSALVSLNYEHRLVDQNKILRYIDAAIRILSNENAQARRAKRRQFERQRKINKQRERQERLDAYIQNGA